eukprot:TRINITY_DN591_c0_g2_i3.p1 TRINITY_DN591_c0_g2~~TRINITY_DN591_c0_g2_i3.p1  ORF type:complete len:110 (+),score=13.82 TRINITY_DN591_c0_g2_i3:35-364(+)
MNLDSSTPPHGHVLVFGKCPVARYGVVEKIIKSFEKESPSNEKVKPIEINLGEAVPNERKILAEKLPHSAGMMKNLMVVILYDVDLLPLQSQAILRRTIEKFADRKTHV